MSEVFYNERESSPEVYGTMLCGRVLGIVIRRSNSDFRHVRCALDQIPK